MEILPKYRSALLFASLALGFFIVQTGTALGANDTVGKGSITVGKEDISEGLNKLLNSVPPPNPFYGKDSDEFARVTPFPFEPYSKFDITFDPNNRKGFQPNDIVKIKGSFGFSSNSQAEINKVTQECQNKFSSSEESKRNIICASPPIYNLPSFGDVGILAQVWKIDENSSSQKQNGDFLVDEFYVANGLEINAGEKKDFTFSWKLPEGIENGGYYVSFFVNSYKRFSLLSFPVNTFSPISRFDFSVKSENNTSNIRLDKNNIAINGNSYSQIHPIPILEPVNGKITIEYPINNPGSEGTDVRIKYELFRWTEENPNDVLKTEEKKQNIQPGGKITESFSYGPKDINGIYDLRISVSDPQGNKSMANVHFSIKGQNRGIFTYLGMAQQNELFQPMFCLRNAQLDGLFEGKVKISLSGLSGTSKNWEKEGYFEPQDGRCFIILDNKFSKDKDAYNRGLKLAGEIYDKNGKKVDQIEILHNSKNILLSSNFFDRWKSVLLSLSIFLLIILFALIFINKMKIKSKNHVKKRIKS